MDGTATKNTAYAIPLRPFLSIRYVFEHPKWLETLVLAAVCSLIPIAGPLVLQGYKFEVIESLHRTPQYFFPAFDFNRFGDYVRRGIWPFLFDLVFRVGTFVLNYALMMGVVVIANNMSRGSYETQVSTVVLSVVIGILAITLVVSIQLLLTVMQLSAGLANQFQAGFRLGWVWSFLRLVWLEFLVGQAFFLVMGAVLIPLAMTVGLFVMVYPTYILLLMSNAHIDCQIYNIFLARGGEPILAMTPPPLRPYWPPPPSAGSTPFPPPRALG